MIFIAGVSASGKTFTLSLLMQRMPGVRIASASRLLADVDRPLRPLTPEQALANQQVLLTELRRQGLAGSEDVFLDGHAMVETTAGALAVPDTWYDAAGFEGFVHIEANPVDIAERRRARDLPWTPEEARYEQGLEREAVHRQAARLQKPVLDLVAGDIERLIGWLASSRPSCPPAADR